MKSVQPWLWGVWYAACAGVCATAAIPACAACFIGSGEACLPCYMNMNFEGGLP